jgi:hypothetical protein
LPHDEEGKEDGFSYGLQKEGVGVSGAVIYVDEASVGTKESGNFSWACDELDDAINYRDGGE